MPGLNLGSGDGAEGGAGLVTQAIGGSAGTINGDAMEI